MYDGSCGQLLTEKADRETVTNAELAIQPEGCINSIVKHSVYRRYSIFFLFYLNLAKWLNI